MIILVANEKGGVGKSLLSVNLASMRALAGKDVLLVDTDRQSSASYWAAERDELEVEPRVACIQKFGKIVHEIKDLAKRYGDIVIDAGGRDSVELRSSLLAADKLFIPMIPSQFDMWSLTRMDELVEQAKSFNEDLLAYVLINRGATNPRVIETNEVKELLTDFENLEFADVIIRDRVSFRRSISDGLAVVEYKPTDQKAISEIENFYKAVFNG